MLQQRQKRQRRRRKLIQISHNKCPVSFSICASGESSWGIRALQKAQNWQRLSGKNGGICLWRKKINIRIRWQKNRFSWLLIRWRTLSLHLFNSSRNSSCKRSKNKNLPLMSYSSLKCNSFSFKWSNSARTNRNNN